MILALAPLPGSLADDAAISRVLHHLDRAIENALRDDHTAMAAKLMTLKGSIRDDESLLTEALGHAEASGDTSAQAHAEYRYCIYLGMHGQFERSRVHVARAVELLGKGGDQLQQALIMTFGGRCYSARAGRLDGSLSYAARASEVADKLDNARLRAIRAMEAEPYLYKGDWQAAIEVAEQFLPEAWNIREWKVVGCASAWLAISYLKLGKIHDARRVLDRVVSEALLFSTGNMGVQGQAFSQIALAQLHLATGDTSRALSVANTVLEFAEEKRLGLEQGAAHRILGEVHGAIGNRDEADAAFRRSLEVLDQIQSRPELAQTLLAYGRFRRGDNRQEDRALVERALALFEEMGATGWAEEARDLCPEG
jgi:tetratricopeptide (TPR) repeat protein